MEYMGPVLMNVDALNLAAMNIAPRMVATLNYKATTASLRGKVGKRGTHQARTYNKIIIHIFSINNKR